MKLLLVLLSLPALARGGDLDKLKAAAEKSFEPPKVSKPSDDKGGPDTPFLFSRAPVAFVGCRPSVGECFNSCERETRFEAKRDPKLCPETREPYACYCHKKK